jgi:hypothetical protein
LGSPLRGGGLVALAGGDGPREVPNQAAAADTLGRLASAAAALLHQTTTTLSALDEHTAPLRITSTVAGGARTTTDVGGGDRAPGGEVLAQRNVEGER